MSTLTISSSSCQLGQPALLHGNGCGYGQLSVILTRLCFVALRKLAVALRREAKKIRDRTEVSLLKAERKRQREAERQAQLERENRLRAARGLAPLADLEEVNDEDVAETPDILLEETVNIASDLARLISRHQQVVMTVQ